MSTCKNCVHNEVCHAVKLSSEIKANAETLCKNFKDKSRIIEPLCKLGGYVYRMEKYNGENKIFRYKVIGISYELHGDETSPLYSARCEELEGYATERLMFFESAVGKTVFLAEEDVEGGAENGI